MKLSYLVPALFASSLIQANEVEIIKGVPFVQIESNGKTYKIEREQKPDSYLTNTFALTSRPSPPFFIEPFKVSEEVETYGELEVLDFLEHKRGLFIDARLENWYEKSAIPGSVNIPFKLFLTNSPERDKVLTELGGLKKGAGVWDFANAKTILLYCNGAWCGQSPTAINALSEIGYPEEKMKYYRGGMQAWQLLGLTTIVPAQEAK
ncbi:rhodanese-like domain-containing protein [Sulfurovum sp. zt1-1]|uniref:Rhodanese-like domain-containing protein n=1 Tax=Sulfurovum zhangzhouensis TaxID=3019067 RepID=A0ABT7QWP1_9BACT|nr:rhodanese-like domain-containing protein [Sulfurovum zhangzhouensis]MDM5271256.1 rhodanese-like domain-containing protein [Sulfurovum zhangzhouensis]